MTTTLTYAHCVKATPGKPDTEPHTEYVLREIEVTLYRVKLLYHEPGSTDEDTFEADGAGMRGYGDTKTEALHDLRYKLMDRSRADAGFTDACWTEPTTA